MARLATALACVFAAFTGARAEERAASARSGPLAGFELRLGGSSDSVILGAGIVSAASSVRFGVTGEMAGSPGEHVHGPDPEHPWVDRRHRAVVLSVGPTLDETSPIVNPDFLPGVGLRIDAQAELGMQWTETRVRAVVDAAEVADVATRRFPFAGLRAGFALRIAGPAVVGLSLFGRHGFGRTRCVETVIGCEKVGGFTLGAVIFGGAEGRLREAQRD